MKNREKRLIQNTIIVAFGKICTKFINFFLLPLYTAVLSTSEYGIVDLLNTYISLLLPIFFLQIDQAVFRYLIDCRDDKNETKKIISTVFITVISQIFLYSVVYFFISLFIDNSYKYFLMTNVAAIIISNILLEITRGMGDNINYSIASLISGSGTIILNVLFLTVFKFGVTGMLLAVLISNILCSLYLLVTKKIYNYVSIYSFDKNVLKKLLKYSIPMVPNQLSWWIVNTSDRTIITYFLGVAFNGIYSAANKLSAICITFFGIFNLTWSESASISIRDRDSSSYISGIVNKSLKICICLCLLIISLMPFMFKFLITGKEYSSAYEQIPILMISTIFSILVSLLGSIYVALKKTKEIAKTSILAAVINIVINILLIKYIGLYAASISTLIAYLAMSIYRYLDIQKYINIRLDFRFLLHSFICSIFILFFYYSKIKILNAITLGITLLFTYIYCRDTLIQLMCIFLKKIKKFN